MPFLQTFFYNVCYSMLDHEMFINVLKLHNFTFLKTFFNVFTKFVHYKNILNYVKHGDNISVKFAKISVQTTLSNHLDLTSVKIIFNIIKIIHLNPRRSYTIPKTLWIVIFENIAKHSYNI